MISETLRKILFDVGVVVGGISDDEVLDLVERIVKARSVFVGGVGRSGLMARAFAMRLMHVGKTTHVVFDPTTPPILTEDLLVLCSGSGRTSSMIAIAERAQAAGAPLALVTSAIISPLGSLADTRVLLPPHIESPKPGEIISEPEIMQPVRTLFEQSLLLFLDALVLLLMGRLGVTAEEMEARHTDLE
jgi:6-phospho-3-hexuloisomerase